MKYIHTPRVDARYWTAITLASVFGTNLGDFYAHESGLGIVNGLGVLAVLAAVAFLVEHFENVVRRHTTGSSLFSFARVRQTLRITLLFACGFHRLLSRSGIGLLCLFGWGTHRALRAEGDPRHALPKTDASYWLAMLIADVFGTVMGDICEHAVGEGVASVALTALLFGVLFAGRGRAVRMIWLYWTTVAVPARAGTAFGDWLAENKFLNIGLSVSTLLTGIAFVGVLVLWRSRAKGAAVLIDAADLVQ